MDSILKRTRPTMKQLFLDPRTKMFLCLTVAFLTLEGNGEGIMRYVKIGIAVVPLIFMLVLKKPLIAAYYVGLYVFSLLISGIAPYVPPIVNALFTGVIVTSTQALPSMSMFCFMIMTTSVSEFIAAMDKLHIPKKVTVPISSMFRFFPTIAEEYAAIRDAMRLRGIGSCRKPIEMLEFRMVPLLTELLSIGNELSASALTRGLDAPVKRENICPIGFHWQDIVAIAFCLSTIAIYVLSNIYGW